MGFPPQQLNNQAYLIFHTHIVEILSTLLLGVTLACLNRQRGTIGAPNLENLYFEPLWSACLGRLHVACNVLGVEVQEQVLIQALHLQIISSTQMISGPAVLNPANAGAPVASGDTGRVVPSHSHV